MVAGQGVRDVDARAVTDGRWRITINADTGEPSEVFDLETDADEARNLVGDPDADEPLEALTAVSVAALTIYDMCKAVDRAMVIEDVCLVHKSGGRSGTWERSE